MHPSSPAPAPATPVLVAVAHGSRDPRALGTARALLAAVRARRPGLDVRLGHIELNDPPLAGTLADLRGVADEVVLVPLMLGRGYHVRHDLPATLAGAPWLRGTVAEPLGPHPLLAEALHDRLTEAGFTPGPGAGVVLAAAGSRDPDSAADTTATAALLRARLGVPVLPGYAAAAPSVAEAAGTLRALGLERVAVAANFASPGRFATVAAEARGVAVAAAPLGAHPAVARLVLHRYDRACAGLAGGVSAFPAALVR
jgi:sirohydrochlorin ferrochelatase